MGTRAFQVLVIGFWLSMMSWLVVAKVLPPLLVGEPPTMGSTLAEEDQLVCWELAWNDKSVGWAATRTANKEGGMRSSHSRVVIEDLPLAEMAPPLLKMLVNRQLGRASFDARTLIDIDPLGHLSSIRSKIKVAEIDNAVSLIGRNEGGSLRLKLSVAGVHVPIDSLSTTSLLGSEFSPQTDLPDLYLGRSWSIPIISPIRPDRQLEVLEATVESERMIRWNGELVETWHVLYRADAGASLAAGSKTRGRMWVRKDGKILQQEVSLLGSQLRFVRLSEERSQPFVERLDSDWLRGLEREVEGSRVVRPSEDDSDHGLTDVLGPARHFFPEALQPAGK